jgi:hypothetical protein
MSKWRMLCASGVAAGAFALGAAPVSAQTNQSGLVNVNLSDVYLQAPAIVQVPVGIAANVCNVSVLTAEALSSQGGCTAQNNSTALDQAFVTQSAPGGGGGGANQNGLVNVNVSDLGLQIPITAQVPVGVAANVCNVSVASAITQSTQGGCQANNASRALNNLVAQQLITA